MVSIRRGAARMAWGARARGWSNHNARAACPCVARYRSLGWTTARSVPLPCCHALCRQKVMEGEIVIGEAVAQLTRLQVRAGVSVLQSPRK